MPYSIYRVYDKLETKFFPFLRNPLLLLVLITHASALTAKITFRPFLPSTNDLTHFINMSA